MTAKRASAIIFTVLFIAALVLTGCNIANEKVISATGETKHVDVPKTDTVVKVDTKLVLEDDFLGVGAQWSSYPWWDISDADWEKLFARAEYMNLKFVRVMIDAFWYCDGFDSFGKPIYHWDTTYMQKLYRLLDWCQANDVKVMFGEWGRPEGGNLVLETTDPAWSILIADCMEHLLYKKRYTCIKYYNLINEPHGWWTYITWDQWKEAIDNLYREFDHRGLNGKLLIAGPDANRMWTSKILKDKAIRDQIGIYDEHWYLKNDEIIKGNVELYTREQVRQIKLKDPGSQFFLGEIGILDGKNKNDQQREVYKFWYGVSMADAAIQCIRGGMSGLKAWDFDDAMHFNGDGGESMNAMTDVLPDNAYEMRKIWGFWNIVGEEMGNDPKDEYIRPWYYAWATIARAFPVGCQTLETEASTIYNLHVAAAKIPAGWGKFDMSFAVVNNSDDKRTIRIQIPNAAEKATMARFEYFDMNKDNAVDAWPQVVDARGNDIFPSPTKTMTNIDLAKGITLTMPGRGLIVLTTLENGKPISLNIL